MARVNKPIIDASLGLRIRHRRKTIGMSQADLGAAIGVSFQQVQKYERGRSSISAQRLHQICDVMSLPYDFFSGENLNLIGKPAVRQEPAMVGTSEGSAEEQFLQTREGQRLVESFQRIADPQLRTRILDFIASLAS